MRAIRGADCLIVDASLNGRNVLYVVASFLEVKKIHSCGRERLNIPLIEPRSPGPNPAFRCLQYEKVGEPVT